MAVDLQTFQSYMQDPGAHFTSPMMVTTDTSLSHAQKQEILESWKVDARELQVAADENMPGDESNLMGEVEEALIQLQTRN